MTWRLDRLPQRPFGSHTPRREPAQQLIAAGRPFPPVSPGKDVLSDVLRAVKLTGALFFWVDASSPWSVDVPQAEAFARIILPHAQHVISYHIVIQGSGWVSVGDGPPLEFAEGDILVIPHGDTYAMRSAPGVRSGLSHEDSLDFFRAMAAGQLPFVVARAAAARSATRYVCGFLGCEARPFNPLLGALPPLIRTRRGIGASGGPLDRLIELTLAEVSADDLAAECVRLRLSELMFVEVVRGYLETLPPEHTGWLAGLRDRRCRPCCRARSTTIRRAAGQSENLRAKPASHAPCLQRASCVSSAARRCNISRDGACNSPRGCLPTDRTRSQPSRVSRLRVRGRLQSGLQEGHWCLAV